MRQAYPPPRGGCQRMSALIFNTLGATFQHVLRNPLKTGTSGNCPETMKVCPKNNTSKKRRGASRGKQSPCRSLFTGNSVGKTKFRGRNESDSYYENTFKNNVYNVYDFAKRQALSVCALTVVPDNERQSVRRIEAAAPAAVAGNRKHRRPGSKKAAV